MLSQFISLNATEQLASGNIWILIDTGTNDKMGPKLVKISYWKAACRTIQLPFDVLCKNIQMRTFTNKKINLKIEGLLHTNSL